MALSYGHRRYLLRAHTIKELTSIFRLHDAIDCQLRAHTIKELTSMLEGGDVSEF